VETFAVEVNTSRTHEEGAHSPSLPHGLVIIIFMENWMTWAWAAEHGMS
jgi:hypothetical protein